MGELAPRESRSWFVFLAIGMFTFGVDTYVAAGLIPGIRASFETSASVAGQGVTAFTLCYALSAPILAALLADKPARSILIVALGLFSVGNALTASAPDVSMFLLGRGIAGIGAGLFTPMAVASASAMVGPNRRGRILSLLWGTNSAGAVIGVPVGLRLGDAFGWRATIALVTILGVVSLMGVVWRPPTVRLPPPPSLAQRVRLLADRQVLIVVGITALTATGSLGLYTYVATMMHAAGAGSAVAGSLWAWAVGGFIGSFSIGYVIDRTRRPRELMAVILSVLVMAVLAVPASWHNAPLRAAVFLAWGAAGWATSTPQQHVLLGEQPAHGPAVVALNGSALCLGSALGAMLGGLAILGGFREVDLPFAAAGVLMLALLGQAALVIHRKTRCEA